MVFVNLNKSFNFVNTLYLNRTWRYHDNRQSVDCQLTEKIDREKNYRYFVKSR